METTISKTISRGIDRVILLSKVMGKKIPLRPAFRRMFQKIDQLERYNGRRTALKQWKHWYECVVRYTMGERTFGSGPLCERRTKSGIPRIVAPFIQEISKTEDTMTKRLILSQLRSFELCKVRPLADFRTIILDSPGPRWYEANLRHEFILFLERHSGFARMFRKRVKELIQEKKEAHTRIHFHYTTKSGVWGPALANLTAQSACLRKKTRQNLVEISSIIFEEDLGEILKVNSELSKKSIDFDFLNESDGQPSEGRLFLIPDKGPKSRVGVIGNYFIQNTLKPWHEIFFSVLKEISTDGTFDQISQASRVSYATTLKPVWSFDLTAATDRIPFEIQLDLMKNIHRGFATPWGSLLKDLTFLFKARRIKYKVGQPMGLYTSWCALAMYHHLLIEYCAWAEGLVLPFLEYAVLGDDVAIWNEKVANRYRSITESLGIQISESKSYIPKGHPPYKAEFAKRTFIDGEEMSAISPGVLKGLDSVWTIPELFTFLIRHGFAEMSLIPMSRIVKVLRLTSKKSEQLFCAFKVHEVLGGPQIQVDVEYRDELVERINAFDVTVLLNERIEVLQESVLESTSINSEDRVSLERAIARGKRKIELPNDFALLRVIESRRQDIYDLTDRLIQYTDGNLLRTMYNDPWGDIQRVKTRSIKEYQDNVVSQLKEVEYLPSVQLMDILKGVIQDEDKKTYRVKYLKLLTKRIFEATKERGNALV
jgi:hypothetical protein